MIACYSDTYSAQITMNEFTTSVDRHLSLREDKTSMMIFGNGDGGGGPLPQMVRSGYYKYCKEHT